MTIQKTDNKLSQPTMTMQLPIKPLQPTVTMQKTDNKLSQPTSDNATSY